MMRASDSRPGVEVFGNCMGFSMQSFHLTSNRLQRDVEISVTLPPGFGAADTTYPVVYAADSHTNCAAMVAAAVQVIGDRVRPARPFLLVNIGYSDGDFRSTSIGRMRDFAPPGEPESAVLADHIRLPPFSDVLGPQGANEFMQNTTQGNADGFLAFLEQELHPEIARRFGPLDTLHGWFGHSWGGLFSLYILTQRSPLFDAICAASPGILTNDSTVLGGYRALAEDGALDPPVKLCVTLASLEIVGDRAVYRKGAIGALTFLDLVKERPVDGLHLDFAVIVDETHFSTVFESFRRFLRYAYAVEQPGSTRHRV